MNKIGKARTPARGVLQQQQQTQQPPKTPARSYINQNNNNNNNNNNRPPSLQPRDPVYVFCRLRPTQSADDLCCFKVISPTTVVLTPPEIAINYKLACLKETQYTFKQIFEADSAQRQVYLSVAQSLVENLIKGKNGLLFTYGVTGSGKTYTMTGNAEDQGIMPRCLDVLFKSIADYQTKKFTFKPDRLNGFEILSEVDAMLERQADMNARFAKSRRKDSDPEIASRASTEASPLEGIDEDNMYAVFITYVEVYNNSVYDLLEEGNQKTLQTKIIREDSYHNMYVHGVTEVEVKTVKDAIDAFQLGQKRKRMGHTILNAESSRSHSVFTIRLVQAPTDNQGENIMQDKRKITVSQLSLVDLAGSERTNRTKNTGQRLREAGNINNSLMTLRTCLEILRENQTSTVPKKVPYRDAKITHLFKNYFDGEGQVRMIVCINPRAEDYDESAQVMKFAEMTQEVQIARATPMKQDIGLTPGRRKANQLFKMAVNNMDSEEARKLDVDIGLVYSLAQNFPADYKLNTPESDQIVAQLIPTLEMRIQKRKLLLEDYNARQSNFRMHLMQLEKENLALSSENASLKAVIMQERQKCISHEKKLIIHECSIDDLNRKVRYQDAQIQDLHQQLVQKQHLLDKKEVERDRQKRKYDSRLAVETDKLNKEMQNKLKEKDNLMKDKINDNETKLKLVADILKSKTLQTPSSYQDSNYDNNNAYEQQHQSTSTNYHTARINREVPVANIRHRRSRSAGDRWLEHRAPNPVPLATILQPFYKNRKSITKLTDVKDFTNPKMSKYCLVSQGADTDGEVETRLYKGNVIPTCGGGAQIVFDDVECLKQTSPVKSPVYRKRPSLEAALSPCKTGRDLSTICGVGIEGHNNKKIKY